MRRQCRLHRDEARWGGAPERRASLRRDYETVIGIGSFLCIALCLSAAVLIAVQPRKQRTILAMLILGLLAAGSVYLGGYVGLPCCLLGIAAMERTLRHHTLLATDQAIPFVVAVSAGGIFLYLIAVVLRTNPWLTPLRAEPPNITQLLPLAALALGVISTRIAQDGGA